MIRWLFASYLFLTIGGPAWTQGQTIAFHHLRPSDGLSAGKIIAISQDRLGSIWFGTDYGLNRFNGYDVDQFKTDPNDSTSISHQYIYNHLTTTSGNLYFSARGVPNCFDPVDQTFRRFCFGKDINASVMYETSPGQIWAYSNRGLIYFDESSLDITFLADHPDSTVRACATMPVRDMAFDGVSTLYLATSTGLMRIDTRSLQCTVYQHHERQPGTLPSNDVRQVAVDKTGSVWCSTDYYGSRLCRLIPGEHTFRIYDTFHAAHKDWADNRIMDLLVDRQNRLWVASLRAGIARYEQATDDFSFILHDPMQPLSISSNSVFCLFEDAEGMIWAGTEGYGVNYFHPDRSHFSVIGPSAHHRPSLSDPWCRAVAVDDQGNYWIGTYKGLSKWDPISGRFSNYLLAQQENSEANNSVRSVVVDVDGLVWVGTGGGLNVLDPRTGDIKGFDERDSLTSSFISFIFKDRRQNLWVCSTDGLFRYHRQRRTFERAFTGPGLTAYQHMNVNSAFEDSHGDLWLGMGLTGLLHYSPDSDRATMYAFSGLTTHTQEYDYITAIAEDRYGIIWLTTFGGVIALDPVADTSYVYTEKNGLGSNRTSAVLIDSLDRVWVATSNGLCLIDADRQGVNCFDVHDGLPTNFFNEGAAYHLMNGLFAYPSYLGLVLFDPERIQPGLDTVPVFVSDFSVAGIPRAVYPNGQNSLPMILRHSENGFSAELTGLYYPNPQKVTYVYTLDGFDQQWHTTRERHINYTNIPGGDYTLRYRAKLDGSTHASAEHTLKIHVNTVYYATWWFRLGVLAVISGLIIGIFRWRLQEQQKLHALANKAQQLEKDKTLVLYESLKQQLNPHFLFNSLTSLRSMIRVDQKMAGEFLDMMSSIYRYILRNREHELVPLKDEIAFAQTYIDLQKTRFGDGLHVCIEVDEQYEHCKIAPVTLQNLIENAIKHNIVDRDSPLHLSIRVEDDRLIVENNLQRKDFVESSNKQGLAHLISLYRFFDSRRVEIVEDRTSFRIRIPLL